MPVLVVGSVALDHVKTQAEEHGELLGGSASFASYAASFYAPVRMVGVIGPDFPEAYRALLARRGIDLAGLEVAEGKTFRWSGEYEADLNQRRTLSIALNVFEHFSPKIPDAYRETDFVLLANIAPSLQAKVLDQVARPKFVVADTMDLWIEIAREDLLSLLGRIDMLILNDGEARALTGEVNLFKAGRNILARGPRFVVIKKGEHGAVLMSNEELHVIPAFPLEEVLDPTGAGDCFAGALIGWCAKQDDTSFATLREAVFHATLAASFNVEAFSLRRLETLDTAQIEDRAARFRDVAGLR